VICRHDLPLYAADDSPVNHDDLQIYPPSIGGKS
jgi:hypothetical protein